jgi:hypothetical protein
VRIKLPISAPHRINDVYVAILQSLLVPDSDAVTVGADSATGIDEGAIIRARAKWRQLQWAAALDRGFDKLIIQKRADICPELCVPF